MHLFILVAAVLLVLACWRLLQILLRPPTQGTQQPPTPPSPPSLEQRLQHLPLSDPTLLDDLERADAADLVRARVVLRQRLINRLQARELALRQQEQRQRQHVLAALREVQRQRFDASLRDLLLDTPAPDSTCRPDIAVAPDQATAIQQPRDA